MPIDEVGRPLPRKEDARLLTGQGRFVADLALPGELQIAFLRSAHAHGRIVAIDASGARALPGVVAVFTAQDLSDDLLALPGMQNRPPPGWAERVQHQINIPDQPLMALDTVRYAGEPVALVVAQSRYIAEDALDRISAQIDPSPALLDPLQTGAPKNTIADFTLSTGDVDCLPPAGDPTVLRVRRSFDNHRTLAAPIECRAVRAHYDSAGDQLTVWSATQVVHWVRRELARQLRMDESRIRCIAPDVGGGFGVKGHVYPEEILVAWLARRLGRPVAWIEDRHEHLLHSPHSRDDHHEAELIVDRSGRILGLIDDLIKDSGAYCPVGIGSPSNTLTHVASQYRIEHMRLRARIVVTNKAPNAPYRGAGRPEAAFVIERLLDIAARELGLDPVEIRRRNLISAEHMPYAVGIPYRDGVMVRYDSGDFPASFDQALSALGGIETLRTWQSGERIEGRRIGLGISAYVEGSGAGPFEGGTVCITRAGRLIAATGDCSQGQSHETVFSQVVADQWQVDPALVDVRIGDTAAIDRGFGTIASRSAVNSSAALCMASNTLRGKVLDLAARLLECNRNDLELRSGTVGVKGVPAHQVSLARVAQFAEDSGLGPLQATEYFEPATVTWGYGTHVALVEVDGATGRVSLLRYVLAHDAGTLLNPMVAEGQLIGAIVQGIGGCLLERVLYDNEGQHLNASLADYLLPLASDVPPIEILHRQTPSPLNPLGVKGLGEGGIIGVPGAIINALCDAYSDQGMEWNSSWIDPESVWTLISAFKPPA